MTPVPPYENYIHWLEKQDKEEGLKYWRKYLDGYEQPAIIPRPGTSVKPLENHSYQVKEYCLVLDETLSRELREIARKHRVTINLLFQAVWGVLLQRYNNTPDVVFGSVVSGRPPEVEGIEDMVGLFINTIPVRITVQTKNKTFCQLVETLYKKTLLSKPHEYIPLAEVQANSWLKGLLIDHIMVFENYPFRETIKHTEFEESLGFSIEAGESYEQTNYDFNIIVRPGETIHVIFNFNSLVYTLDFIENTAMRVREIFRQVMENPGLDIDIGEIDIVTEEEKHRLLDEFNDTEVDFPGGKTIPLLFEEQAERTPDNIALHGCLIAWMHGEDGSITYKELNKKSNQLAQLLRTKGSEPDTVVGIMVERSLEMIVGILGILKSGSAYLPIDPDYPEERIKYMLADSNAIFFLAAPDLASAFEPPASTLTSTCQVSPSNLAYVIYTSGSTGRPKGIMLEHRGLVNLVSYHYRHTNLDFSRVAQFASICFDVSFQEIFFTLLAGGTLYVLDKQTKTDISAFCRVIKNNKIQTLFLPISFIKMIFREPDYAAQFRGNIRHIVSAGEQVVVLDRFRRYLKENSVYLHNHYGPSETHVVTALTLDPDNEIPELPSIGRPISNTVIYILDKSMQLQPVGITGELAVGGIALGRGYLNNPELTYEKFIEKALSSLLLALRRTEKAKNSLRGRNQPGAFPENPRIRSQELRPNPLTLRAKSQELRANLYLTGDLARWLVDGNIEFLGRIDHQVKIRGFKEARVIDRVDSSGDKYLCAYIVSGSTAVCSDLKEYLSRSLPGYMVPSYFVRLEKMPLTPSGKLDRNALPKPGISNHLKEEYMAPRNELEEQLVEIWSEVLSRDSSSSSRAGQLSISINDSFFDLGGHSLKAAVLAAKIHKIFNTMVPLAQIFKTPSIREMSRFIESAKKIIYKTIPPVEKRDYYPQSSAQKRLFFLDKFENIGTGYNMPFVLKIQGTIDSERFQEVFHRLVQQHESLRTSFHLIDNEPIQRIHEAVEFEIEFYDLYRTRVEAKNYICPFDLRKAPQLRVCLIKEDETRHILMIDMHHIISDGTSMEILADEFARLYTGQTTAPLRIQYKDFSQWQNHLVETGKMKEQETYWLELYKDADNIPVVNLPVDYPRPLLFTFEGDGYRFQLGTPGTQRMKQLSDNNHTTIFMNLLAAFNVLLYKYTGQEDIIVGIGTAGRRHADLHRLIGLFVNMLALPTSPTARKTYREFLKEVKQASIKTFENQDMQFEELVDKLELKRDTSRNPLFDVCLVNQNFELSKKEIKGVIFEPYETFENKTAKFDLTLFVYESKDNIYFNLEYYTPIFKRETIVRLANHFLNLLERLLEEPGALISDIDIMSAEERNRLLYDFNDTEREYPADKTLHQLFAEQAERTPDNIALIGVGTRFIASDSWKQTIHITYRELNQQSNRLGNLLRGKGVLADTIVAIMVERSVEMIIGTLGILKSGGAYLPIDPDYPEERIKYMLTDSGAKVLLTGPDLASAFEPPPSTLISTSTCRVSPANLAYIIYTSGSTGKPKGTLTNHYNVIPVVKNTNYIEIKEDDRILQLSNYAFDGSVFDIYGALLNGAALILIEKEKVIAVDQLADLVKREAITMFFITTALFNALVDLEVDCLANIRKVLFGGERVSMDHSGRALQFLGKNRIIHVYGPTETTVYATFYFINRIEERVGTIPIGSPLANTNVYILDKHMKPVPLGVNGEIYIGGDGVARGYLNNPELTAEKFIDKALSSLLLALRRTEKAKNALRGRNQSGAFRETLRAKSQELRAKLYKTGDLARWLPDGNIEFIGRIDHQVKLRGFRVEPGEIESRLLEHEYIKEVVVTVSERGIPGKISEKYLCAYLVSTGSPGGTPGTSELRDFLTCTLPDYMIPSYFISLEKIPLTPNGKVDRKALPGPGIHKYEAGKKYVAPRNELEEKIAGIWSEVLLGNDAQQVTPSSIGIDDDFFELGGHSLKATVLLARVHKELDIKIPLPEIFIRPTIRGLGEFIRGKVLEKFAPIAPIEEKEYYPLSSAQKRIYILQQADLKSTAYNIPQNVVIKGDPGRKMLEETFMKLIQRHESLRTSFHIVGEEPVQRIHDEVVFEIEYYDLQVAGAGDRCKCEEAENFGGQSPKSQELRAKSCISSFIRPFDLSHAPLLRLGLIKIEEHEHILMLDMHHIVSDGASLAIFIREFAAFYEEEKLPGLRIQYKDFAKWQDHPATSGKIKKQEEYWLRQLGGELPTLYLPIDSSRTTAHHSQGTAVFFEIGNQLSLKVKQLMGETGTTAYMLLLAVYTILLSKYTGQEDIIVGSGIAGRRHADMQNVIGMFVNMLAMRNRPEEDKTFMEFLEEVKENSLNAYENQDYQFDRLVEKLGVEREFGRNPIFDTQFTFQNLAEQGRGGPSHEISGLKVEPYESGNENKKMQFDLSLNGVETGENIVMTLQYVTALFRESTVREMTRHYLEILDQVVEDTNIKLRDINVSHDLLAGKSMLKEEDSLDYDF